jgi:hypothetical protein
MAVPWAAKEINDWLPKHPLSVGIILPSPQITLHRRVHIKHTVEDHLQLLLHVGIAQKLGALSAMTQRRPEMRPAAGRVMTWKLLE